MSWIQNLFNRKDRPSPPEPVEAPVEVEAVQQAGYAGAVTGVNDLFDQLNMHVFEFTALVFIEDGGQVDDRMATNKQGLEGVFIVDVGIDDVNLG